jgi:hypothetical protein
MEQQAGAERKAFMGTPELSELTIQVSAEGATEEDLDRMTRQLLSELREMDVERVELGRAGAAPDGAKVLDPVTTGSILVTVLPSILPKILDGVQAWAMRGSNRTVKFKGKIAGQAIEFEGSGDDLQRLLATLDKPRRRQ